MLIFLNKFFVSTVKQDQRLSSPAVKIHSDTVLRVRKKKSHPWASRGGVKLDFALTQFKLLDKVSYIELNEFNFN